MCLLINQPKGVKFSTEFLVGVFKKNKDGIGVMYVDDNKKFVVKKILPRGHREALNFYKKHIKGRECVVHYRMQTHGDIDLLNCHPYQVVHPNDGKEIWLMHNGVLRTGNDKDKSKSDTWHYIEDFLKPMLTKNPEFMHTEAFKTLVGSHIGPSNKFVLLDADGKTATVNYESGYLYNDAWLSNTYAWQSNGANYKSCAPAPTYSYQPYKPPVNTQAKPSTWGYPSYHDDYEAYYGSFGSRYYGGSSHQDSNKTTVVTTEPAIKVTQSTPASVYSPIDTFDLGEWTDAMLECVDEMFEHYSDTVAFTYVLLDTYYMAVGATSAWELHFFLTQTKTKPSAKALLDVLTSCSMIDLEHYGMSVEEEDDDKNEAPKEENVVVDIISV